MALAPGSAWGHSDQLDQLNNQPNKRIIEAAITRYSARVTKDIYESGTYNEIRELEGVVDSQSAAPSVIFKF